MAARLTPDQYIYWQQEMAIADFRPSHPPTDLF
jgi:hypothetical protein